MIITPLQNATRLRVNHDTAQPYIGLYNIGTKIYGGEVWVAPETTSLNRTGDQWLKVESIDGVNVSGWMAITHNGVAISKEVKETPDVLPVEVKPFNPQNMTLVDPVTKETRHYNVISLP